MFHPMGSAGFDALNIIELACFLYMIEVEMRYDHLKLIYSIRLYEFVYILLFTPMPAIQ